MRSRAKRAKERKKNQQKLCKISTLALVSVGGPSILLALTSMVNIFGRKYYRLRLQISRKLVKVLDWLVEPEWMNQLQWRDKKDDVDNDDWLREYCFAIDASAFWLDSHTKEWGFLYIDFMGDNLAEIEPRDQLETQDIQERVDCDASGNEFQSPHQKSPVT